MSDWEHKKVLMIGAARQGIALARFLAKNGASVILNDRRPKDALREARTDLSNLDITWVTGSHPIELLDDTTHKSSSNAPPSQ